jgi:uncharacterized RDD family membrane protein YckC
MQPKLLLKCPPASLFKQLVAMLYDSFLIAALLFIATAILLPFNKGEAISGPLYNMYLLSILFIFYSGFWKKAGQTLGMKAWKIRIIDEYGNNPPWSIGFLRLIIASFLPVTVLGLNQQFHVISNSKTVAIICVFVFLMGYLVRLVRPFTVHDRLSQTKVIDISQLLKQQQEVSS